jgi:hypothetical protein
VNARSAGLKYTNAGVSSRRRWRGSLPSPSHSPPMCRRTSSPKYAPALAASSERIGSRVSLAGLREVVIDDRQRGDGAVEIEAQGPRHGLLEASLEIAHEAGDSPGPVGVADGCGHGGGALHHKTGKAMVRAWKTAATTGAGPPRWPTRVAAARTAPSRAGAGSTPIAAPSWPVACATRVRTTGPARPAPARSTGQGPGSRSRRRAARRPWSWPGTSAASCSRCCGPTSATCRSGRRGPGRG